MQDHNTTPISLGALLRLLCVGICFVLTSLGPELPAPNTALLDVPIRAYEATEGHTLQIIPMGAFLESDLNFLARSLEARSGMRVEISAPQSPPVDAFNFSRGQFHADKLLDWLFYKRPPDAPWGTLAVLSEDLYATDDAWVYGLANLTDRVAVMSTHRFKADMRHSDPSRRILAEEQFIRASFHELGHMLGLPHCDNQQCLMSAIKDRKQIDAHTTACPVCVHRLHKKLTTPRDLLWEDIERGDGFFHRGHMRTALEHYARIYDTLPTRTEPQLQAEMLNRLGAVLLSSNRPAAAEQYIKEALDLVPSHSPALYNFALIQGFAGNEAEAIQTLEQWRSHQSDEKKTHEQTARFYLDVVYDPGSALLALRAYQKAGGENPQLLKALKKLQTPSFIVFPPEEGLTIDL